MVRSLDSSTQSAIRDPSKIIIRNFVSVNALDGDGDLVQYGFTDWGENVTLNVIDGRTGATVSRNYAGDGGPIMGIDPIPLRVGIEIPTVQVTLSQIHSVVQDMVRNHNIRGVEAQIHRAYLDPVSYQPVAAPRCRLLGFVNGAPITTPEAGNMGGVVLQITSHTRELTRTNPAKRSDETQKLRSNDRFRRYGSVAGEWDIFWGQDKAKESDKAR